MVMKNMKFTSTVTQIILLLLLVTASAGCEKRSFSPTPTLTDLSRINVDELNFQDFETKQHFGSLDQCINNVIDSSWTTIPYQLYGDFYRSTWCHGSGVTSECQMASSTEENRDLHVLTLSTITYPQDRSAAFGLGIGARWAPAEPGWGAHFYFWENGDAAGIGDDWNVIFNKFTSSTVETTAALSFRDQYQIQETHVAYSFGLPLRDDLALYLKSAEAMRTRRLEQIQGLAQIVKTTIETHQATICGDLGPYLGNGIPPACVSRPLTPEEEIAELAKAENYFSDQKQILNENYQDLYTAWMKAFPMNQCWP